jgi:prolyl-tRNA synthetase
MKISQNFTKTTYESPADETSCNAQLLIRAGYINKTMPGVYSYMPLGLKMLNKIENIVRKNMNSIGGQEILMNSLHPKDWWIKANRWDNVDILFKLKSQTNNEYALACSHEEQVVPIASSYFKSYKDLPDYSKLLFSYTKDESLEYTKREAVHFIIYNPKTNKYLLTDFGDNLNPNFHPIGGGMYEGETIIQTAKREMLEETGFDFDMLTNWQYIGRVQNQYKGVRYNQKGNNYNLISHLIFVSTDQINDQFNDVDNDFFISKWFSFKELDGKVLLGFQKVIESHISDNLHATFPLCIYQIQTKFRDELRAKSGLLRGREFRMKDMYDFHTNKESQDAYYELVKQTYHKIYSELGLKSYATTASGGIFTTNISHEFQVECSAGEDWVYKDSVSGEVFNEEMAPCEAPVFDLRNEEMKPKQDIELVDVVGVEALCKALNISVERTTKTILYEDYKGNLIVAVVRGDRTINEAKLTNIVGTHIKLASEETILKFTKSKIGYAGVVNLPVNTKVFWDKSCQYLHNFETGTNKTGYHTINVCFGRDLNYPDAFFDITEVQEGDINPNTKTKYDKLKTAEVGNIFKLDDKYTKAFGVTYTDQDNKPKTPLMNCHGIGTSRCMAIIAELYSDEKGLKLPKQVAPFEIYLVTQSDKDPEVNQKIMNLAEGIYSGKLKLIQNSHSKYQLLDTENTVELLAFAKDNSDFAVSDLAIHEEVLWDDRTQKTTLGEKLKDAELIGLPIILVITKRSLENGGIELIIRSTGEKQILKV